MRFLLELGQNYKQLVQRDEETSEHGSGQIPKLQKLLVMSILQIKVFLMRFLKKKKHIFVPSTE